MSLFHDWDWQTATNTCKEAISDHGEGVRIRSVLAWCLITLGRSDEAIQQLSAAMANDPLCLQVRFENCFAHYLARRHREGIELCKELCDAHPNHAEAYRILAQNHAALGEWNEAHQQLAIGSEISRANPWIASMRSYVLGKLGRNREAEQLLAELHHRAEEGIIPPLALSLPYLGIGQVDEALRWLQVCVDTRHFWMVSLNVDPWFDTIRDDPRFVELVDRVGINQAAKRVE